MIIYIIPFVLSFLIGFAVSSAKVDSATRRLVPSLKTTSSLWFATKIPSLVVLISVSIPPEPFLTADLPRQCCFLSRIYRL